MSHVLNQVYHTDSIHMHDYISAHLENKLSCNRISENLCFNGMIPHLHENAAWSSIPALPMLIVKMWAFTVPWLFILYPLCHSPNLRKYWLLTSSLYRNYILNYSSLQNTALCAFMPQLCLSSLYSFSNLEVYSSSIALPTSGIQGILLIQQMHLIKKLYICLNSLKLRQDLVTNHWAFKVSFIHWIYSYRTSKKSIEKKKMYLNYFSLMNIRWVFFLIPLNAFFFFQFSWSNKTS